MSSKLKASPVTDDLLKKIISRLEFHTGLKIVPVKQKYGPTYHLNLLTPTNMVIYVIYVTLEDISWYFSGYQSIDGNTIEFFRNIVEES